MHDSAYQIGKLVMQTYCDLPNAKILEIGALNVNGCLRDFAMPTTHYIGLDLEAGPSVDHVISSSAPFPVENDDFDLVMASSVFEHDPRFWETFLRMCRATRGGGHIYINVPSNGVVHRFPMDCWRFYPDAGVALVDFVRAEGIELELVESFTGKREKDIWNDFSAVFRKGPCAEPLNTDFVYRRYPSVNALTWESSEYDNEDHDPEDMTIIRELRTQCEDLIAKLANQEMLLKLAEEEAVALSEEIDRLGQEVTDLRNARDYLKISLREQIGQMRDSLTEMHSQSEGNRVKAESAERRLAVFRSNYEDMLKAKQRHVELVCKVYELAESGRNPLRVLMNYRTRQKHLKRSLQRLDLFDADAYIARHPDVGESGMDPVRHFILHGMHEGREQ